MLGHRDEALTLALEQLDATASLSFEPVRAEALFQSGRILTLRSTREDIARGQEYLEEGTQVAMGMRHDELHAELLNFRVLDELRNADTTARGHELSGRAFAAIRRIGDRPRLRAEALRHEGLLLAKDGDLKRAEATLQRALELLDGDEYTPWLVRAAHLRDRAEILRDQRKYDEARRDFEQVLSMYSRLGSTHPHVAHANIGLAVLEFRQGHRQRARELASAALAIRRQKLGETHALVGAAYLLLANIELQSGMLEAAEASAVSAMKIYQRVYDASDARLSELYQLIGGVRFHREDYDGARAAYKEALASTIARVGPGHVDAGYAQANLAEVEVALGRHDDALIALADARAVFAGNSATSEPLMDAFLAGLRGRALLGKGQAADAIVALEDALTHFDKLDGDGAPLERAAVHWALAQAHEVVDRMKSKRAREHAHRALSYYRRGGEAGRALSDTVLHWLQSK